MAPRVSSPVFIGRVQELARLRAALERARSGSPAAVVVAGEAGVGKTRLVGELRRRARELNVLTLTGGCLDVGDGVVPFAPIVEALRTLTTLLEPAELERVLGGARAELTRLVPELAGADQTAGALPPGGCSSCCWGRCTAWPTGVRCSCWSRMCTGPTGPPVTCSAS